jgi:hypothetical protein
MSWVSWVTVHGTPLVKDGNLRPASRLDLDARECLLALPENGQVDLGGLRLFNVWGVSFVEVSLQVHLDRPYASNLRLNRC